jgi:hypothetical protein
MTPQIIKLFTLDNVIEFSELIFYNDSTVPTLTYLEKPVVTPLFNIVEILTNYYRYKAFHMFSKKSLEPQPKF